MKHKGRQQKRKRLKEKQRHGAARHLHGIACSCNHNYLEHGNQEAHVLKPDLGKNLARPAGHAGMPAT
jgi:hypothetical protein